MLDPENFTYDRFNLLIDSLESRMAAGENYVQPDSYLVDVEFEYDPSATG